MTSPSEQSYDITLLPERIKNKIVVQPNGCWLWIGATTMTKGYGYGRVRFGGKDTLAHRTVYELLVGPIPDGKDLDHQCHNRDLSCMAGSSCPHRRCVNPAHLEPSTGKDNILRGRGPTAINAAKIYCKRGHLITGKHEGSWGKHRKCIICTNASLKKYYQEHKHDGPKNPTKTHCKHGHEFTPENTHHYGGARHCRICARVRIERFYAKVGKRPHRRRSISPSGDLT